MRPDKHLLKNIPFAAGKSWKKSVFQGDFFFLPFQRQALSRLGYQGCGHCHYLIFFSSFQLFVTDSKCLLLKSNNPLMTEFRQLIGSLQKEYFPNSWIDSTSEIYKLIWPYGTDRHFATTPLQLHQMMGYLRTFYSSLYTRMSQSMHFCSLSGSFSTLW